LFSSDNDQQVSVEECITLLRTAVTNISDESTNDDDTTTLPYNGDLQLTIQDDDDVEYIQLQVIDDNGSTVHSDNLPNDIASVLQHYQNKVYPVCCDVLTSAQDNMKALTQLSNQITIHEEKIWDVAVVAGYKPAAVRTVVSILAQNKARVKGTIQLIRDVEINVKTTHAKVRAAMLF